MTTLSGRIDELPSAFDRLESIVRAARGRQVTFFLDFDGTLSPIVERPEDARLPAATRRLLAEMATRRTVAVVSGRDLDDVRSRVGLDALYYAGSHGLHLAGPGGLREAQPAAAASLPALERAGQRLDGALGDVPGVQVERKRFGVAVHFRRAGRDADERVRHEVEAVIADESGLRLIAGRKVRELRPDIDWDKGRAIGWIEEILGLDAADTLPVVIGDDVTDEDAFRAVAGRGVAIVVLGREGESGASCALDDPDAVRRFLEALDAKLGDS